MCVVCCQVCRCCAPRTESWVQKRPWHGSVGRRCSCKATERTGLTVIWHTVKDPRNLHSDCVPVGRAEPAPEPRYAATGSHPKVGLSAAQRTEGERKREGGGPVSKFTMAGCHLFPPLFNIQQHIHWHVYTHTHTHSRESSLPPLYFDVFY